MPYYKGKSLYSRSIQITHYTLYCRTAQSLTPVYFTQVPNIYNFSYFPKTTLTEVLVALYILQAPALASTHWLVHHCRSRGAKYISPPTLQDQKGLYTYFILSAVSALHAVLEREILVITCSCFHLEKLRLIIFQI